jgi:uncharacterized protein YdcH (DUF465 family)
MELTKKEKYNSIISLIEKEENRAYLDFEVEIKNYLESNELQSKQLIETLFLWKLNYLNSKDSNYFVLKRYLSKNLFHHNIDSNSKSIDRFFVFFEGLYAILNQTDEESLIRLSNDVYSSRKKELFYKSLNEMIKTINNNHNIKFKFPQIENFELDFIKQIPKLSEKVENLSDMKDKLKNKVFDLKYDNAHFNSIIENLNSITAEYESKINELDKAVDKLKDERVELRVMNRILSKENSKVHPYYVSQFDNTCWGDNYPALKELYRFLHKKHMIKVSWSYFVNLMEIDNNEVLHLYKKDYNFSEIGYLLNSLSSFFIELKNRKDIRQWFISKIVIDGKVTTISRLDKYFRDYRTGITKDNIANNKDLIDELINTIHTKFYN